MCMRDTEPRGDSPNGLGRVVVTGAASGIGRATAAALLVGGWKVLALDRDRAALDQMLRELGTSDALVSHALDLTRISDVEQIIDRAADAVPLRGLVCCAAIGDNTPFLEIALGSLRSVFEINFMATFALCQMAARQMVKNGGGAIVNISSVSGLRANAGRSAYGASKAALEMLSKIMAVELAPKHVRVNTLAPGPTLTSMAAGMHLGTERQRLLRSVPQGRYATPEEIAEGVAFLLDERRSSYVTGHTLCIDGGMYAAGSFESAHAMG
jgi:NAD(P)-dependent dehydrogenase (short-subunit alcohol dehydrogenase family)